MGKSMLHQKESLNKTKVHCKGNCKEVSDQQRLEIFNAYYNMKNYTRQRGFVHGSIEKTEKKTPNNASKRKFSSFFYLPVNRTKIKVC